MPVAGGVDEGGRVVTVSPVAAVARLRPSTSPSATAVRSVFRYSSNRHVVVSGTHAPSMKNVHTQNLQYDKMFKMIDLLRKSDL